MMRRMGFGSKWFVWMKGLVFKNSLYILVIGNPREDFKALRDLCQGDSWSPFLFLMVAEGLSGMMQNAMALRVYKGFQIDESTHFELLQFSEDKVLIGDDL